MAAPRTIKKLASVARAIESLGDSWRVAWVRKHVLPKPLKECWKVVTKHWKAPNSSIVENLTLCHSILQATAPLLMKHAGEWGMRILILRI